MKNNSNTHGENTQNTIETYTGDVDSARKKVSQGITNICDLAKELDKLKKIQRFQGLETTIKISDSVFDHITRLFTIVSANELALSKYCDIDYLKTLIILHDLPEVLTGDIPTHMKDQMTIEQKASLQNTEREYYYKLATVAGIKKMDEIINDLENKKSLEPQILKLVDMIDGFYFYYFELYKKHKKDIKNNLAPLKRYLSHEGFDIDSYYDNCKNQGCTLYPNADFHFTILDKFFINRINDGFFKNTIGGCAYLRWLSARIFGFIKKAQKLYEDIQEGSKNITSEYLVNTIKSRN